MSLPRRSQSALEYMMTYGWAILVIVIVAGVLYSLGIFSPSSAISSTVTGFSNLGSVTAQCIGNQGLTIQLGDSIGYTIQITNISVSASGKTVNMPEQSNIAPSGTKVFYISNVCPSPSSRYSLSVTVYYTEPGQIFPGPYTSTGTITGSSSKQQISSTPAFDQVIPLTITNSQDNSTPNPYQQMVIVPSSVYGGYAASNFQNVEFFYSNGSIVPSWLQNYTSTNATWWLKLSSISASSSKTVYMGFVSKSDNIFNKLDDGEAPQIPCGSTPTSSCSNYAEYDDGANVFYDYVNFNGTNLPTTYSVTSNGGSYSVDNGIHLSDYFLSSVFSFNTSYAIYGTLDFSASGPVSSFNSRLGYVDQGDNFILSEGGNSGSTSQYLWNYNGSNSLFSLPSFYNSTRFLGLWTTHFATYGMVGSAVYTNNKDFTFKNLPTGITVQALYVNATAEVYDLMIGGAPPNGIMPSVSFGYPSNITKPTNIQSYAPLTISNNQNVSVSNFQQMVNVPSSVFTGYANTASGTAFQNLEFFYSNGTVIPSWLENYTSSNALYWIKLPSVPAEISFTVYLGFASTPTNLFNTVNDGEAPQLSSSYGEYNNIANVMNQGLLYQFYQLNGGGIQPQTSVYQAQLTPNSVFSYGSLTATAGPTLYQSALVGSSQDVDGTTEPNVIINYQYSYSGGSAFPNPPISNPNYVIMKAIGFVVVNSPTTIYGETDDGMGIGYSSGGGALMPWLGGSSTSDNPNNIINSWVGQGATQYSGTITTDGSYRLEIDYTNQGGPGEDGVWSNTSINYYSPSQPPNSVMPSVNFGSVS